MYNYLDYQRTTVKKLVVLFVQGRWSQNLVAMAALIACVILSLNMFGMFEDISLTPEVV